MNNKYILDNLEIWTRAAKRELRVNKEFAHYFLDRELGHPRKNTRYKSMEDWKKDINKLLIKNI